MERDSLLLVPFRRPTALCRLPRTRASAIVAAATCRLHQQRQREGFVEAAQLGGGRGGGGIAEHAAALHTDDRQEAGSGGVRLVPTPTNALPPLALAKLRRQGVLCHRQTLARSPHHVNKPPPAFARRMVQVGHQSPL